MPKFKKRPDNRIFEAKQFHADWAGEVNPKGVCHGYLYENCAWAKSGNLGQAPPHLHTIHDGQLVALEDGDWVVAEPDGIHYYPIKPDIFAATYEPADESLT